MSDIVPDDGWIEWSGGECPVEPNTLIRVKTKDGRELCERLAWANAWDHPDLGAYRVVAGGAA